MSVETFVFERLKAVAGVTSLVGTGDAARIYPNVLPQAPTYPAVSFFLVDSVRWHAMGADTGDVESRVQVDAWDEQPTGAIALGAAVRAGLSRFNGTVASVVVQDIYIENELGLPEPGVATGGVFRQMQDFRVVHKE